MNPCTDGTVTGRLRTAFALLGLGLGLGLSAATASAQVAAGPEVPPVQGPAEAQERVSYGLNYNAQFLPSQGLAKVSIKVVQSEPLLRKLEFKFDAERFFHFEGTGVIQTEDATLRWEVPEKGGELRYSVRVDHLRESSEYDARLSHDWALLRASDLFPPGIATSRTNAHPDTRLRMRYPPNWKALAPFPKDDDGSYRIDAEGMRFDRPAGWMLLGGKLDILSASIGGMRVRIGGPSSHGVRARDLLALLRWTVPLLEEIVGTLPERLVIVSAEDPMWRGGLSGPSSMYLHAERPLIESDGTSPALHELIHVVMRAIAGERSDWVVEGMAEYYSLQLLRRSGTISQREYDATLTRLAKKAAPLSKLGTREATFSDTARAVLVMRDLDQAIRDGSEGSKSLDDVFRVLTRRRGTLSIEEFVSVLREHGGGDFSSLLPPVARK